MTDSIFRTGFFLPVDLGYILKNSAINIARSGLDFFLKIPFTMRRKMTFHAVYNYSPLVVIMG